MLCEVGMYFARVETRRGGDVPLRESHVDRIVFVAALKCR